jgi:hypothetical protein
VNRGAVILEMKDDAAAETCAYTVVGIHHKHVHRKTAEQIVVNFMILSLSLKTCRPLSYWAGQEKIITYGI